MDSYLIILGSLTLPSWRCHSMLCVFYYNFKKKPFGEGKNVCINIYCAVFGIQTPFAHIVFIKFILTCSFSLLYFGHRMNKKWLFCSIIDEHFHFDLL